MKIIELFPQLMGMVKKSEDMFLLLHGTATIKNFIFTAGKEILKVSNVDEIVSTVNRLLQPDINE